jgi:hypothetical protein
MIALIDDAAVIHRILEHLGRWGRVSCGRIGVRQRSRHRR